MLLLQIVFHLLCPNCKTWTVYNQNIKKYFRETWMCRMETQPQISSRSAWFIATWASIPTAGCREVSKPRDLGLNFYNRSDIWKAPRQQRCRDACRISERCGQYSIQSRGFDTSRDLAVRRPLDQWIDALPLAKIKHIVGTHVILQSWNNYVT